MNNVFVLCLVVCVTLGSCRFAGNELDNGTVRCASDSDCPTGFVCKPAMARCFSSNGDNGAPVLLESSSGASSLRRGADIVAAGRASKALAQVKAVLEQGGQQRLLGTQVEGARFTVTGAVEEADQEGLARVFVEMVDLDGNASPSVLLALLDFDFTAPKVQRVTFLAPRSPDESLMPVRPSEAVSIRVVITEEVRDSISLKAVATGCQSDARSFELRSQVGPVLDFDRSRPAGTEGCVYSLVLGEAVDAAGNVASEKQLSEAYLVDGEAPALVDISTGRPLADGGLTPATVFSAQAGFDALGLRFRVVGELSELTTRLDTTELPWCTLENCIKSSASTSCSCQSRVSTSQAEGGRVLSIVARDEAGNTQTASVPLVFDFTAPRILANSAAVALTAPPGCPINQVGRATVQTGLGVSFAVDEALREVPTVSSSPTVLSWTEVTQSGGSYVFGSRVSAQPTDGLQRIAVRLVDTVGNSTLVALDAGFEIDTQNPSAPNTSADGGIVYVRQPWGAGGQAPSFSIGGSAGSFEPNTTVLVTDGPDPNTASELGRASTMPSGAFEARLLRADRPVVYISSLDSACNRSASRDVKRVRWVASLGGKATGSLIENPHMYETRENFHFALEEPGATELASPQSVMQTDGIQAETSANYRWEEQKFAVAPVNGRPGFSSLMTTYDPKNQVLLGVSGTGSVWEWRNPHWILLKAGPSGDDLWFYSRMVFDTRRRRAVIVASGPSLATPVTDTWEWDGENLSRRATTGLPNVSFNSPWAYDPTRGLTVLLGSANRIYEWDGAAWRVRVVPGGPTSFLGGITGFFDEASRRLLFVDATTRATFALTDSGWSQASPPDAGPKFHSGYPATVAFDPVRQTSIAYGATVNGPGGETWQWNGAGWALLSQAAFEHSATITYDVAHAAMIRSSYRGVALLDGGVWQPVVTPVNAPYLAHPTATFDSARKVTVASYNGGWHEWDGHLWRSYPSPFSSNEFPLLMFDEVRRVIVAQSRGLTRTWDGRAWTVVSITGPQPTGPQEDKGFVFDVTQGRGVYLTEGATWLWSGFGWFSLPATRVRTALGGGLVFDQHRRRPLWLSLQPTELSEFSGTNWTAASVSGDLPQLGAAAVGYDLHRAAYLIHGGFDYSRGVDADVLYRIEGLGVSEMRIPGTKPLARRYHAMTYDSDRRRMVVLGGPSSSATDEHWELFVDPHQRPAHLVRLAFSAAGAGNVTLESAQILTSAGAAGSAQPGASLWVYEAGAFSEVATNSAPPSTPQTLAWSTADTARLGRLPTGARQDIVLTVTPSAENGTSVGKVTVDEFSMAITYLRP